jgi:hypothetical protein
MINAIENAAQQTGGARKQGKQSLQPEDRRQSMICKRIRQAILATIKANQV